MVAGLMDIVQFRNSKGTMDRGSMGPIYSTQYIILDARRFARSIVFTSFAKFKWLENSVQCAPQGFQCAI